MDKGRRRLTAVLLGSSLGAAIVWVLLLPPRPPDLAGERIDQIRLRLIDLRSGDIAFDKRTVEPGVIAKLAQLIATGRPISQHRCANYGWLTFSGTEIEDVVVSILPGHSTDHYEFRVAGNIYQVPRGPFFEALAPLGASPELLDPDDPDVE